MNILGVKLGLRQRLAYFGLALFMSLFSFPTLIYADDVVPTTETTQTTTYPQTPAPTTPADPVATTPPATETPAPTTPTPPPPTNTQGPQSPTGVDGNSYTYNEATGLWENSKYTWDPVTKQTSPKQTPTYSYNPSTGRWDTTEWVYDAPSGVYVPNVISAATPPTGATLDTSQGAPDGFKNNDDLNTTNSSNSPSLQKQKSTTSEADKPNSSPSSSGIFDRFYNALISNSISSTATSGDALVSMNTLAGNALSGDASAIATVFNLLQSLWSLGTPSSALTTFTQNIFGSLVGDLWLNTPSGNSPSSSGNSNSDVTVNASQDAAIHNTITLDATSGDADVTKNTTAGDATTGSATVVANIINAINSSIVSGSSFVGMLNIYGSLNGDILLPQDLISKLLATNAVGTLDTSNISNATLLGQFNNDLSTTNNVNATASSGNATVDHNTSAGNAASGNAETNVTLLNLTGRQVVGKNALLVFVNVLGSWVGMIVDAPTGSTSAAFGGGVTSDSTLAVTQNNNQAITNDINITATSGDATVANNTTAGNATSGDAMAAVNILNMNNSQFALSDWFGVLFINVFGSWTGDFGRDTIAGTLSTPAPTTTTATSPQATLATENVKAYRFVPETDSSGKTSYHLESADSEAIPALAEANVLDSTDTVASTKNVKPSQAAKEAQRDWTFTLATMALGGSLLGTERFISRRKHDAS